MLGLPTNGRGEDELFAELDEIRAKDLDTKGGRTWAYVYDAGRGAEIFRLAERAYLSFLHENALDPTVFPSLLKLENDVVAMAASHLSAPEGVVGNFTTGGTESIMMALKAARDFAAETRGIGSPEIILPVTAHAAFHKAAHYFGIDIITTPVDTDTWKADVASMAGEINENTIMLVGSAVSYAHGVVDPIPEIAALAAENGLLCHVDGCIGGFILPYFRQLGASVTDFDFVVPGVTSMSMDLHKYAYTPKGASVVLYRDAAVRRHQLFACAGWTGYTVINTTFQSTKSGGALAAAWTVMNHLGENGYTEIAERTLAATRAIIDGVEQIDELSVMGTPEANLIALSSDTVNVFEVVDEMRDLQWYVQPQLGFKGSRENIHLSVSGASLPLVPDLLADFRLAIATAKPKGPSVADPDMVALLESIDPSTLDDESFAQLLAAGGLGGDGGDIEVPDKTSGISAILNACPAPLAERLLVEFFNRLYVPTD